MKIFGFEIKRKPKNKASDSFTYSNADFWSDISNAHSTNREMKISAVFRCVDVLSDNISMLPWGAVDTKTHQNPNDPYMQQIWYLLNIQPNRNMTPAVFFKTIEQHRLNGNAYAEIVRDRNGMPQELVMLTPSEVELELLGNGYVIYKLTTEGGERKFSSDEVLHFKNISKDGLIGESVLSYASDSISVMSNQEKYNKNFYEKGGRPSGILTYDTDLSEVIKKRNNNGLDTTETGLKDSIRRDFQSKVGGAANAGSVAVLDNGIKYQAIQPISQKDMAYVESKEASVADIARFYGVPLYKLFTGKESYQSNEQNNIAFVTDKLNPIITGYEQELTVKLIPHEKVLEKVQIKGNLNVLMRGDIAARTSHYKEMWGLGAYNINKILDLENQPSIGKLGDRHFASKNYAFLEEFAKTGEETNQETGGVK